MAVLGIDTSCYTTSIALAQGGRIVAQARRMLDVKQGGRGLRQSDAVFQHNARLAALIRQVMGQAPLERIDAVCASARPRPTSGSYMPVFTVGEGYGRAVAAAMRVPFFETSHQQGHLRAALVDTQADANRPLIAMHLSGGTTETLLYEHGEITLLGGTKDLHAGQLIDRIGVALGAPFPAGPHLEKLATPSCAESVIPTSTDGLHCHFSGAEAQARRMIERGQPPELVASEVFSVLIRTVAKMLAATVRQTRAQQALLFGGVACSTLLRAQLQDRLERLGMTAQVHWARGDLSGDNAAGVALLGAEMLAKYRMVFENAPNASP